jgi:hypothetical protein
MKPPSTSTSTASSGSCAGCGAPRREPCRTPGCVAGPLPPDMAGPGAPLITRSGNGDDAITELRRGRWPFSGPDLRGGVRQTDRRVVELR